MSYEDPRFSREAMRRQAEYVRWTRECDRAHVRHLREEEARKKKKQSDED